MMLCTSVHRPEKKKTTANLQSEIIGKEGAYSNKVQSSFITEWFQGRERGVGKEKPM